MVIVVVVTVVVVILNIITINQAGDVPAVAELETPELHSTCCTDCIQAGKSIQAAFIQQMPVGKSCSSSLVYQQSRLQESCVLAHTTVRLCAGTGKGEGERKHWE